MAGLMSRNKGKRGEREVIDLLQPILDRVFADFAAHGWEAPRLQRNTLQSDGGGFDVVGLEWLALEVKFQESYSLNGWWTQTRTQAEQVARIQNRQVGPSVGQVTPVLIYRKSRVAWRIQTLGGLKVDKDLWVRARVDMELEPWLVWMEVRLKQELDKKTTE